MREQKKYYKTTLERIKKDYYGVVMDFAIANAYAASRTRTMDRYPKRELTISLRSLICLILG
jgi:hypothetical protein